MPLRLVKDPPPDQGDSDGATSEGVGNSVVAAWSHACYQIECFGSELEKAVAKRIREMAEAAVLADLQRALTKE